MVSFNPTKISPLSNSLLFDLLKAVLNAQVSVLSFSPTGGFLHVLSNYLQRVIFVVVQGAGHGLGE